MEEKYKNSEKVKKAEELKRRGTGKFILSRTRSTTRRERKKGKPKKQYGFQSDNRDVHDFLRKIALSSLITGVEKEATIKEESLKASPNINFDCFIKIIKQVVNRKLKKKFEILAQEWKSATAHLSSTTEISLHPAYQRIIGMGETAVPFILQEMSDSPDHWFWALKAITGDSPVPAEHRGRIELMTEDWLVWGKSKGYIR